MLYLDEEFEMPKGTVVEKGRAVRVQENLHYTVIDTDSGIESVAVVMECDGIIDVMWFEERADAVRYARQYINRLWIIANRAS